MKNQSGTRKKIVNIILTSVGCLIPVLIIGIIASFYKIPDEYKPSMIDLSGRWKIHAGANPEYIKPGYNHNGWPEIILPGSFYNQGFRNRNLVLRKTFSLNKSMQDQNLWFMIGGTRGSMGDVYVNGYYIGEIGSNINHHKMQGPDDKYGFLIPRKCLAAGNGSVDGGSNVITIEFTQEIPGYDGVQDPRIIIGVADYFKTYFNKNIFINSFFQYGIILTSIFVFAIMVLLLIAGWRTASRCVYISAIMLILSAVFYNICFSTTFLKYVISFSLLIKLILASSIFVGVTITDFIHYFFLRRINIIAKINRLIAYSGIISLFFIDNFITITKIFNVLFIYSFIIIMYLWIFAFTATWKAPIKRYGIIITTSTIIISCSAISDILTDLSPNHVPFLTNITISIFIVLCSIVIIADFIDISDTNKALTSELRHLNATLEVKVEERTRELNSLATIDALSGLYNRREITTRLEKELTANPSRHLSLIFFDIDNFKKINDIFGHQAGDKVISLIGGLIKSVLTISDIPGRYGGDEFLLILPGADIRQANRVATELKTMIAGSIIDFDNHGIPVTASFGISSMLDNEDYLKEQLAINSLNEFYEIPDLSVAATPDRAMTTYGTKLKSQIIDLLIKMADDSLYRAKSNYCNQCGFRFTDIKQFENGKCPHCGSNELSLGKNKIVAFGNEINN